MQPDLTTERRKRNIPAATDRRKRGAEAKADAFAPSPNDDEQTTFMKAMERYKRENRRPFPTWSEVLEVLRSLGYRKVGEQTEAIPPDREQAAIDPAEAIATIDRRQRDVPVARERRHHGDAPPVPPKG